MYKTRMYTIGPWHINVSSDVEIYSSDGHTAELIPHSQYGERFCTESTLQEKQALVTAVMPTITGMYDNGQYVRFDVTTKETR